MKEDMMHIVKKDRKKLWILGILALVSVFLLIFGNTLSEDRENVTVEDASFSGGSLISDAEDDLEHLLSSMDGVGEVDVIIRYEGDIRESYAYNEEYSRSEKEDGSSESTEKKEMVLIDGNGEPVVTERVYPSVSGVVVAAEGAAVDGIRERLLDAVSSYFHIGKNRIEVTAMGGRNEEDSR